MNKKSLQIIASWLLLSVATIPLFHPSALILLIAFVISIAIAVFAFSSWKTSYPWFLFCAFLYALSFFGIRGDDRTKLMTLLGICVVGLAIANYLYLYASVKDVGKRHNQTEKRQKTK